MLTTNEYFEGNVKSIAFETSTLPATVGVMAKGEYTFGTDCKEIIASEGHARYPVTGFCLPQVFSF